jgi:site-specific DNA recombinase
VLTRTTYIGRHRLNTKVFEEARTKTPRRGGRDSMPPIVAASNFEAVQDLLKIGGPAQTALRVVSSPTLPTGIPSA